MIQWAHLEGKKRSDFFLGIPGVAKLPQPEWMPERPPWSGPGHAGDFFYKKESTAAGSTDVNNKSVDSARSLAARKQESAGTKLKLLGERLKRQMMQLKLRRAGIDQNKDESVLTK